MIESDLTVKELMGQYKTELMGFQKNAPSCERVICALEDNAALITFPLWLYILTRCVGMMPYSIINVIGEDMNKGDPFSKIDLIHPIFTKKKRYVIAQSATKKRYLTFRQCLNVQLT